MNIPSELKQRRQWINWDATRGEDGKQRKIPLQPDGTPAKSNDPATWHAFEDAKASQSESRGLGFVFSADDPYVGIDLDNAIDASGEPDQWAAEILKRFPGAFIERSPSGAGLHIIAKGTKPEGCRSNVRLQPHGGIEVYSKGRYFTVTGDCIGEPPAEIASCQAGIDWLADQHLKPAKQEAPAVLAVSYDTEHSPSEKERRAAAWLQEAEPAIQGNNGSRVIRRNAMGLVEGFALDSEQAYRLLASIWNPICSPPWSEKELQHAIRRAVNDAGKDNPVGYKLAEGSPLADEPTDEGVAAYVEKHRPRVDVIEPLEATSLPKRPGEFPEHLLSPPGFLGCVADWITRTATCKRPVVSLAAALAGGGAVYGRRIAGPRNIRSNVLTCALVESGGGKDHPMKSVARLFEAAGAGGDERSPGLLGSNDICSKAGIVTELLQKPSLLLCLDEIGEMLAMIAAGNNFGQYAGVPKLLRTLSTSAGDTYRDGMNAKGEQRVLDQPHLVVMGMSTRGQFYDALNKKSIEDGLVGRLLVFDDGQRFPDDDDIVDLEPPPRRAVEAVAHWYHQRWITGNIAGSGFQSLRTVDYTTEARERIKQHRRAIRERQRTEDDQRATLWQRVNENAARLALIHSCSRRWIDIGPIELQDVEWGIGLANHLAVGLTYAVETTVAESETDSDVKRLVQALDRSPGKRLDRSTVTKSILKEKGARRRDALLMACESEQVGFAMDGRKLLLYLPGNAPEGCEPIDLERLAKILPR